MVEGKTYYDFVETLINTSDIIETSFMIMSNRILMFIIVYIFVIDNCSELMDDVLI